MCNASDLSRLNENSVYVYTALNNDESLNRTRYERPSPLYNVALIERKGA